jgi:hypothetical protein
MGTGKKVLLVEDEANLRSTITRNLVAVIGLLREPVL